MYITYVQETENSPLLAENKMQYLINFGFVLHIFKSTQNTVYHGKKLDKNLIKKLELLEMANVQLFRKC